MMGGCSAINCSNHSRKGHRMFKFPEENTRRTKWTVNCRRDNWIPGKHAQLCSDHFEESQFEQARKDGWKRLRLTAIPTLFKVPKHLAPETVSLKRVKGIGSPKPNTLLSSHLNSAHSQKLLKLVRKNKENIRRHYAGYIEKQCDDRWLVRFARHVEEKSLNGLTEKIFL